MTDDEISAQIQSDKLTRAAGGYCRHLAGRLALSEPDYEFGGYDASMWVVNWGKMELWQSQCTVAFEEIWTWRYWNILARMPVYEDERLQQEAIDRMLSLHAETLQQHAQMEEKILKEAGLYNRFK